MMRVVPSGQALSNMAAYRDAHSSSIVNIAHRSSSGEVSTSYDRHRPRVLPGTLAGPITGISNGIQHAAAAADPALALKRSEELAYQAVLQVGKLAACACFKFLKSMHYKFLMVFSNILNIEKWPTASVPLMLCHVCCEHLVSFFRLF
jgi:hypothetical protein